MSGATPSGLFPVNFGNGLTVTDEARRDQWTD